MVVFCVFCLTWGKIRERDGWLLLCDKGLNIGLISVVARVRSFRLCMSADLFELYSYLLIPVSVMLAYF